MIQSRREQLAAGLVTVRERIRVACEAVGRADTVGLLVVTKTFPVSDVAILAELGVVDVGENRDQEARAKRAELAAKGPSGGAIRWHMLGTVQRNKAASVAQWADAVDSVDRIELVAALANGAAASGRKLEVLVQVSLDAVAQHGRGGIHPAGMIDLAAAVVAQPTLQLRGVMGVAPFPGDPDEAFERLAAAAAELQSRWPGADRVSAGMSGDLEKAIAHGATQVRVGGAILGSRAIVQ